MKYVVSDKQIREIVLSESSEHKDILDAIDPISKWVKFDPSHFDNIGEDRIIINYSTIYYNLTFNEIWQICSSVWDMNNRPIRNCFYVRKIAKIIY